MARFHQKSRTPIILLAFHEKHFDRNRCWMELNLQIMTSGNAYGEAAHDFWKWGRATQTNLDLKNLLLWVLFFFFKKKVLGENKILSERNVCFIDYCTFKCIVLVGDRLHIIQMRILKPSYETSGFFLFFFFCWDFL